MTMEPVFSVGSGPRVYNEDPRPAEIKINLVGRRKGM
jgi:hypothetical protein